MATVYSAFDSTPATLVADIKTKILLSSDWSNPAGQRVLATTTRGSDMCVDLADSAATAIQLQFGVYRTAALADKLVRYLAWRNSGGATSDMMHVRVSAGKEHLYIDVEGPRAGETNAMAVATGSGRQYFFLGDLVPYFASDAQSAVVLVANSATTAAFSTPYVWVSRNQGNTASWVQAFLVTLTQPVLDPVGAIGTQNGVQRLAAADGKMYMFPYVVFELTDGLRGRINKAFYCGATAQINASDPVPALLSRLTYGSNTYILIGVNKGTSVQSCFGPFGVVATNHTTYDGPVVAIPYS